jgi:hypothetical protein
METETEQNAGRLTISLPQKKQSQLSSVEWRTKQLLAIAEVFREPLTAECLAMYVESLADLSDEQIRLSIGRAIRELKWFPKPAELRELVGSNPKQEKDAEGRKAWDVVTQFVTKYVGNDVHGNYGPEHGWYPKSYPKLSDRILGAVRRTGGWRLYKSMTEKDYPFQQKRFLDEYEAWTAVEQIAPSRLLTEMPRLRLVAKPMDPPRSVEPKVERPEASAFKPTSIPVPLTNAQLRDRREMLRQQAASLARDCEEQGGGNE